MRFTSRQCRRWRACKARACGKAGSCEKKSCATDEAVKIVVATPGVRTKDLSVKLIDDTLHINGKSARGTEVFGVRRRVFVPHAADPSTATVTHENGELVVSMRRRSVVNIPVNAAEPQLKRQAAKSAAEAAPDAAAEESKPEAEDEAKASSNSSASEDEWVRAEQEEIVG